MFPTYATTRIYTIKGNHSSTTIETGDIVILGAQIQQENLASNTALLCNGVDIVRNWARDTPMILMQYRCAGELAYAKTGADTAMLNVTYTTSTPAAPTSSAVSTAGGFTYGEIVSTTFLFTLTFLAIYAFYWFTIHRPIKP